MFLILVLCLLFVGALAACAGETAEPALSTEAPDEEPEPQMDDEACPIISETPPEQLMGVWHNGLGIVLAFPDAAYTPARWEMHPVPTGAYQIYAIADCGAHSTFWLFPVGVEMIRYWTNMSLVPSDTLVVRVYQGSFEVTTCCADEDILQEVFYRMGETPLPTPDPTGDIKAQVAGFWRMDWPNPVNASIMILFEDGRWESPGPLPMDHNMGGSFIVMREESGVYQLRFTIAHTDSPWLEIGYEFEGYHYDAQNDRLFTVMYSEEGPSAVLFVRGLNPPNYQDFLFDFFVNATRNTST